MRSIVMQRTEADVVRAAVKAARTVLRVEASFAAVASESGDLPMAHWSGIHEPRWGEIVIRPNAGVGGQVLASGDALAVADYEMDPRISHDFLDLVVGGAGLHSMVCVPVLGPAGIQALLYLGSPQVGILGDRAVDALKQLSTFAGIALEQVRARELEVELVRLRERERLAGELHDSVAQRLFTIGALARGSQSRPGDSSSLNKILAEIDVTAADARSELRDTIERLNVDLDDRSLELRLEGELRLFESLSGCTARVVVSGNAPPMSVNVEQLLVDTAVEGLRNAVKHARAKLVAVDLLFSPAMVSLQILDQEAGLRGAVEADEKSGTSVGLQTLRCRAQRLGGHLELRVGPAAPTVLKLDLPLNVSY